MPRLILLVAAGILAYVAWQKFTASNAEQRRKLLLQWLLIGLAFAAVVLAVTGRLHWVGAAIAVILPLAGKTLSWLGRHLPWLAPLIAKRAQARQETGSGPAKSPPLTEDEARRILDVPPRASRDDIISAHRKLIQKLHPDRGGNDYLASRINAAKELLLENL
ncbi:DnaJ domain-containing protein [Microbulbifer sp. 2201CG32-9]|uniref:DnaJ domain-containing protein n=1 Tax=Microbulbifer sp. 2201CG32-9 TaxID=3232309 RepID=UPI00345BC570